MSDKTLTNVLSSHNRVNGNHIFDEAMLREWVPHSQHREKTAGNNDVSVIDPPVKMGILGNKRNFSVALDGSTFYPGSSNCGFKVCDCRQKGVRL